MRIRDLGALSGPVLLFGGPYSNLQATTALIDEATARRIDPSQCICTGDVVAYCAQAAETVALIREFGCPVVAGNMEQSLGRDAVDCGCGFENGTACDLMSGAWFAHANAQIAADDRAWMRACPDWITFTHGGRRHAVVHGAPSDVSRFVWSNTPDAELRAEWEMLENITGAIDVVISGHSGIDFERNLDGKAWINAGVIGMPPHDGETDTRYAILTEEGVEIHRLSYDCASASQAMGAAELTQGYHAALLSGYWPSEDVLPSELRVSSRARG